MLCQPHREELDEKEKEKRIPDELNPRALAKNLNRKLSATGFVLFFRVFKKLFSVFSV